MVECFMTKHKYRNQRERKPQKEIVYLHEKKKQKISTIHEPDLVAVEELNTVSPAPHSSVGCQLPAQSLARA